MTSPLDDLRATLERLRLLGPLLVALYVVQDWALFDAIERGVRNDSNLSMARHNMRPGTVPVFLLGTLGPDDADRAWLLGRGAHLAPLIGIAPGLYAEFSDRTIGHYAGADWARCYELGRLLAQGDRFPPELYES